MTGQSKPPRKRRVYWTISNERGRVIADGLTPEPMTDRDAISWVLQGGPDDGTPPILEADKVYRVRAGDCAATARGDELERVDAASTLDETLLAPGRRYLFDGPVEVADRYLRVRFHDGGFTLDPP